jgi:hypothetical protein
MKQLTLSKALIKTWFDLLRLAPDHEAHIHAKRRLIKAFGRIELASMYAEDNEIIKSNTTIAG